MVLNEQLWGLRGTLEDEGVVIGIKGCGCMEEASTVG